MDREKIKEGKRDFKELACVIAGLVSPKSTVYSD